MNTHFNDNNNVNDNKKYEKGWNKKKLKKKKELSNFIKWNEGKIKRPIIYNYLNIKK